MNVHISVVHIAQKTAERTKISVKVIFWLASSRIQTQLIMNKIGKVL